MYGSVGRPSGVHTSDDHEDYFTPVEEVGSGKRKPKWLQDTLNEATLVAGSKRQVRESKPFEKFCSYMELVASIVDTEPSSYEEAANQEVCTLERDHDGGVFFYYEEQCLGGSA